ncbi:MAG: UDP-N-acetylmuramyl-tripeptide synthetase [Candidatus Magasanikbacteria bacterium GW2011_GWA2_46_17]|uniref:UDP-N-acetylmuramyl-tripeptide synthetase n=1 Tax=Candidatus Magasanikbacteria bacterium GW2011_GWA2_46_17 TaxID=1619042 RepID=A0A0G1RZB6_9BACT|nr:MAG: UDP-N-acetylmuramyl-tripeptide synthetase [Candidatus Magasanikbacteria bacterium GW2011_GWA2_46_17]
MMDKLKKIFHFFIPQIADIVYGYPGKKMVVIGVTGTKGKSTTCKLISSVLEAGGNKVGLMSTVEFKIGDHAVPNDKKMSMLGRGQIQKMLREMVKAGCRYAVIETSSEGILQYRHLGVHYDIVVFTNLGTEHSERHGGFENLKRDKGKIFADMNKEKHKRIDGKKVDRVIVANTDDKNADYYLGFNADKKIAYCLNNDIQYSIFHILKGSIIKSGSQGSQFDIGDKKYEIRIQGEFNVYNALAAVAVGESRGIPEDKIAKGLASVTLVPGRMEFIDEGQDFKVIVDYAHEPLSYAGLFSSCKEMMKGTGGRLIAVIGSDGGGRDKGKRRKMGEIAGKMADYVVVTDVNCHDEDPLEIAEMLAKGSREAGKKDGDNLFVEIDRRQGIEKAISLARANDIIVITAKGTEPCIVVADGKRIPWDDRKVAREVLRRK